MTDPTNSLRQLRWRRRREAEAEGRTVEIRIGRAFYWVAPDVAAKIEALIVSGSP